MTINEMYDFLRDMVGANAEALDLAFGLNGFNEQAAQDILFWYTGYNNFEEYEKEIGE